MTAPVPCPECAALRRLLWLHHGHVSILYGDDGGMQCPICFLDFERAPLAEIERRFFEQRVAVLAGPGIPRPQEEAKE
jgi:hypothetical protein